MRRIFTTFLLVLCSLPVGAQAPQDTTKSMERIEAIAKQHRGWGTELSSPGVSVEKKEINREDVKGQTAVRYQIYVQGLPKDQQYNLLHWPINGNLMTILTDVRLEETGRAFSESKAEPIDLVLFAGLGEPKRFAITSQDVNLRAMFIIVPFPIRGEDRGCVLEAELLTPDSEALFIRGTGFPADSEVTFDSTSEGEKNQGKLKSNKSGEVSTVVLPYVTGKNNGKVLVEFRTEKCKPQVTVAWGKGTYKVQ